MLVQHVPLVVRTVAAVLAVAWLGGGVEAAHAQAHISVIWTSTTGTGVTGSETIAAAAGDSLEASLVLTLEDGVSVSQVHLTLVFDEDGQDELLYVPGDIEVFAPPGWQSTIPFGEEDSAPGPSFWGRIFGIGGDGLISVTPLVGPVEFVLATIPFEATQNVVTDGAIDTNDIRAALLHPSDAVRDPEDEDVPTSFAGARLDAHTTCGDGIVEPGEGCDDGNQVDGDGCQSTCQLPVCGDAIIDAGEECDDGNTIEGDGCNSLCLDEFCGDGILNKFEQCDDGNNDDFDGCNSSCFVEICGDGIVQPGEECDGGDGCRSDCTRELCGDGIEDPGEECDDGNNVSGDGCEASCTLQLTVSIDVKPGSDPNSINPLHSGEIAVAILGSGTFDVRDIDGSTLGFGPARAPLAHTNGPHLEDKPNHPYDVNGDGHADAVAHFNVEETLIAIGDTEGCVVGEDLGGEPFAGCDEVRTTIGCGIGFEVVLVAPLLLLGNVRRRRRAG